MVSKNEILNSYLYQKSKIQNYSFGILISSFIASLLDWLLSKVSSLKKTLKLALIFSCKIPQSNPAYYF